MIVRPSTFVVALVALSSFTATAAAAAPQMPWQKHLIQNNSKLNRPASMFTRTMAEEMDHDMSSGSITSDSDLGRNLLKKASLVSQGESQRDLENDNNNYYDMHYWVSGYSLRFESCHELAEFDQDGMRNQIVIKFKLCQTGSCNASCNGPVYVIAGEQFVKSYYQAKMEAQEYKCDLAKEACEYYCYQQQEEAQGYYNNNNEEGNRDRDLAYYNNNGYYDCESECLQEGGNSDCIDNDGDDRQQNSFDEDELEKYMECREMEDGNGSNDNNNENENNGNYYNNGEYYQQQQYFIGAYCANSGKSIYLGVFKDENCQTRAPSGTYEKFNYYGNSLPYSVATGRSIVTSECIPCKEQNNKNDGNYYEQDADEISEMCEEVYEESLKCESQLSSSVTKWPNTNGCNFINNALSKMEQASKSVSNRSSSRRNNGGRSASTTFAWIFGLSTLGLGYYVYVLHKKKSDNNQALLGCVGSGGDYGNGRENDYSSAVA